MALPVLAYTVVMIASTPIFGSHYFVDLIAGTAVALAVMATIRNQPRYAALRPQRPEGTGIGDLRGWRFPVGSR
jgi:membrane-associated phospholipid phosphatase